MDVVGHQAVAVQAELVQACIMPEEVEVDQAVRIGFEDDAPGVAALRDVVGRAGGYHARKSGHNMIVGGPAGYSQEIRKRSVCHLVLFEPGFAVGMPWA